MKALIKLLQVSEMECGDGVVIKEDDNFIKPKFPWKGAVIAIGISCVVIFGLIIPWMTGFVYLASKIF